MVKNRKISKNILLFILIIIFMSLFIKIFQEKLFSEKYFLDSHHILAVMNGSIADQSYLFTANIFKVINILNFSTLSEWRYLITLIFLPITLYLTFKKSNYHKIDFLFIFLSIALLNIYVFNLSKDIIQYIIFLIIAILLSRNKIKENIKLILITTILLIESYYFRIYYALIACTIITIYYLYSVYALNSKNDKKSFFKLITFIITILFIEIFVVSKISTSNYNAIINARYNVNIWRENSLDAITIVNDLFGVNKNYFIFILNYIVNFVRFIFPIELLFKGVKYIPFILYQLFIIKYLVKIKEISKSRSILPFIIIVSFIIISVIFEPDFGSFIKHEIAIYPVFIIYLKQIRSDKNE